MRLNYSVYCCLMGCAQAKCRPLRRQQIANKGVFLSFFPSPYLPFYHFTNFHFRGALFSRSFLKGALRNSVMGWRERDFPCLLSYIFFLIIVIMYHQEGRPFLLTLFNISYLLTMKGKEKDGESKHAPRNRLSAQKGWLCFPRQSAALLIILSSKPGLSDLRAEPVRAAPVMWRDLWPHAAHSPACPQTRTPYRSGTPRPCQCPWDWPPPRLLATF